MGKSVARRDFTLVRPIEAVRMDVSVVCIPEQEAEQKEKHHMDKQRSIQLQHLHLLRRLFPILKLCVVRGFSLIIMKPAPLKTTAIYSRCTA